MSILRHDFTISCIYEYYIVASIVLIQEKKTNISIQLTQKGSVMYAKFPFYSVAQMYALSLNTPVAIMLGGDNLYWVVDRNNEMQFVQAGCSLLSHAV